MRLTMGIMCLKFLWKQWQTDLDLCKHQYPLLLFACWNQGTTMFFLALQTCQTAKQKLHCPHSEKELSFLSFHCLATLQNIIREIIHTLEPCCFLMEQRSNNNMSTQKMLMNTVLNIYWGVHVVHGLWVNTPLTKVFLIFITMLFFTECAK